MFDDDSVLPSLREAALSQHEMFLSWIAAGFTPEQAMELMKTVIIEVFRGAGG